jgi:hypothetical protein
LAAAGGAAAAAAVPAIFIPKLARAWGARPADVLPAVDAPYRVLEIFLYGGMSAWETFYLRQDGAWSDWFGAKADFQALSWCSGGPSGGAIMANGADSASHPVFLGPGTKPLWDLRHRLRTFVVRHNLGPHEAAIPYAVSGLRLGNARLAGMGAHIQRFAQTNLGLSVSRPRSYVLMPPGLFDESRLMAMTASGQHPGSAKPMLLRLGGGDAFVAALARPGMTMDHDRLVDVYRDQYRRSLRWGGPSVAPTPEQHRVSRGHGFAAYQAAIDGVLHADDVEAIFDSPSRLNAGTSTTCGAGGTYGGTDYTRKGIELAAHLFANEARYVGIVDGGLEQVMGAAYDTHNAHPRILAFNLHATLSALRDAVDPPGGGAPLIDLDQTLVVLNTEFGRTRGYYGTSSSDPLDHGRDHNPEGYAISLLGGPIGRSVGGTPRANAGVRGTVDDDGFAIESVGGTFVGQTVTDVIAGVLLAAGINPRAPEVFGVGDLSNAVATGGDSDATTMGRLAEVILGVTG